MWTDLLHTHGYWLLALGCLLEGETVLVLAGLAAHRGVLDPVTVVAIAAIAGFAGDQALFWLGRRHGDSVLARWPAAAAQSARLNALLARWHDGVVVGVRFAYGLRIAGPLLLGMAGPSARRFAVFNAAGALSWALTFGAVGWFFGAAAEALLGELRHVEGWLFVALAAIVLLAGLGRRWRQARRGGHAGAGR
mgnify:CR=1 FL=1